MKKIEFVPHDYQIDCARFMIERPFSGCFLDVGEGKTSVTYMVASTLRDTDPGFTGMIVVTTKKIMDLEGWIKQNDQWGFGFKCANLHGKDKLRNLKSNANILIINYEGLFWLLENVDLIKQKMLVLDESSKAKSFKSNRFRILKKLRPHFNRVHLLSATPTSQSYEDLFSQMYLLDNGERLGRFITHYRNEYFNQYGKMEYHKYRLQKGADVKIFDKIKDIIYKTEIDYLKLPKAKYNDVIIKLPKLSKERYKDLELELIAEINSKVITAVNAGVKRGKLKQFCNGSVYDEDRNVVYVHDAKIKAAKKIVKDLKGSPILIGYEFKHDLQSLLKAFPNAPYFGTTLEGKKPNKKECMLIEMKWNSGLTPILLGQISSVAHGLNLQKSGHNLMFFSHLDKLEDTIQFIGRLRRQGQKKRVIIHRLIVENSVDIDVINGQERKMCGQKALLDAMKKRINN